MASSRSVDRPSAAVPVVVRQLCGLVAQVEQLFRGRRFTLDGHLVGSIGEVLAAERYGLTLMPMAAEKHDAKTDDGRLVQIKTTQGRSVGLRSEPDYLLVLTLSAEGRIDEVYNGPGAPAWAASGKLQRNGTQSIGISRLRALMSNVPEQDRIPALID